MDSGLQIKELAEMVGVTEDTVINLEIRNTRPTASNLDLILSMLEITE